VNGLVDAKSEKNELESVKAEIRLLRERLDTMLSEANDGYWELILTAEGAPTGVEYLSPRFKEMFGYRDEELENSLDAWQKLIYPEDLELATSNFSKHIVSNGKHPYYQEVRYCHRDGSTVWVICHGVALKNSKGEFVKLVGTHQDITALKNTEEALKKAKEELVQFARLISKDLSGPLLSIQMYVRNLTAMSEAKFSDKEKTRFYLTKKSSDQNLFLLNNLLAYSRIVSQDSLFMNFDLNIVKDSIQRDLGSEIQASGAKLNWPDLPSIHASPVQLSELFYNLISNSLKFHRKDIAPQISIQFKEEAGYWEFAIKDNGIGIASEDFPKLFKAFKRLQHDKIYPGAGIGLASSKKIVEKHDGEIWLKSKKDEGSTFYFTVKKKT